MGAIVAAGLWGEAVTIPNTFSAGEALSAAKLNANFSALGTAVTALEANGSVNTARIADGAVTASKIGAGAVSGTGLADNSVNSAKIIDGAVSTADIADGAVGNADLSSTAVSAAKTIDEPGAAQAESSVTVSSTSQALLFSQSITVLSGFILVIASGDLCISHFNGTDSSSMIGVAINGNVVGINQQTTFKVPATAPTGEYCFPMSSQKIFTVTSAGQQFVELVGQKISGQDATGRFTLSAMSIATNYGTVSN
jgi:hypothetical protein